MLSDNTISAETYRLLQRVPTTWWSEDEAVHELSLAMCLTLGAVRSRLQFLIANKLVERRKGPGLVPALEIRRVGR